MHIEKSKYLNEWIVRDRNLGFSIDASYAQDAYMSHLHYLRTVRFRRAFTCLEEPLPTAPILPSFQDFLIMLAQMRWKVDGLKAVNTPPPTLQIPRKKKEY